MLNCCDKYKESSLLPHNPTITFYWLIILSNVRSYREENIWLTQDPYDRTIRMYRCKLCPLDIAEVSSYRNLRWQSMFGHGDVQNVTPFKGIQNHCWTIWPKMLILKKVDKMMLPNSWSKCFSSSGKKSLPEMPQISQIGTFNRNGRIAGIVVGIFWNRNPYGLQNFRREAKYDCLQCIKKWISAAGRGRNCKNHHCTMLSKYWQK